MLLISSYVCLILLGVAVEITARCTAQRYYTVEKSEGTDPSCQATGLPLEVVRLDFLRVKLCGLALNTIRRSIPEAYSEDDEVTDTGKFDPIFAVKQYHNSPIEYVRGYTCAVEPAGTHFLLRLTQLTDGDHEAGFDLKAYVPGGPANPPA